MHKLVKVLEVHPLDGYRCIIAFEDGVRKEIDLKPFLHGPIFEPILKDLALFRSVRVVDGTIGWENGADIDPDVLYYELRPSWMEESVID